MKIMKFNCAPVKVDRKLIRKFGESIYHADEVQSIEIIVNFKDGSSLGYKRHEIKDELERAISEEEENEL